MKESTYTVVWEPNNYSGIENKNLKCGGLTARVAFARLIRALENSGPILVKEIRRENE